MAEGEAEIFRLRLKDAAQRSLHLRWTELRGVQRTLNSRPHTAIATFQERERNSFEGLPVGGVEQGEKESIENV